MSTANSRQVIYYRVQLLKKHGKLLISRRLLRLLLFLLLLFFGGGDWGLNINYPSSFSPCSFSSVLIVWNHVWPRQQNNDIIIVLPIFFLKYPMVS